MLGIDKLIFLSSVTVLFIYSTSASKKYRKAYERKYYAIIIIISM